MNRLLHLFVSLLMVTSVVNSIFTRGPLMEAVSFSLELERENSVICQDHFLVTPHLPFLFTHENNVNGLDHPNSGSPLSNSIVAGIEKHKTFKITRTSILKSSPSLGNVPIFIRVRSLRN